MRFKSEKVDGYQVFAVTGTNTISFGIDFEEAETIGLLGFGIERIDKEENQRYFTFGFKVFPSVIKNPDERTTVKTNDHPIQSFVTDDFTAKSDREYEYLFHPLKGSPKNIDRSARSISIKVRTEKKFSTLEHDIFFNRGVASSQAYSREFNNQSPSKLDKTNPDEAKRARQWLSRDLDDAILKFIGQSKAGDTLLCCFYEFRYEPVVRELKAALDRGVSVKIIIDAKVNESIDKKTGRLQKSFPREDNLETIERIGIASEYVIRREAKPGNIAHNKFMVLLEGEDERPAEIWTGSTNISDGGFHGQTNVGHWVRNEEIAKRFKAYWDLLSDDPGPKKGDDQTTIRKENKALRDKVEKLFALPASFDQLRPGVTPIFSPRNGPTVLDMYATMVDQAKGLSCITLAFGIGEKFKQLLSDNQTDSAISLFLLEKEDKPNPRSTKEFIGLSAENNVYKAWGSYLEDPLYQWAKETNARALALNKHVSYIHSKFLLMDPLSADPIVVTGSANFSEASTNDNDENMLAIRGNQRVADIYFTEFNRLFYHYYFRSIQEKTKQMLSEQQKVRSDKKSLFLVENDSWIDSYKPGTLKQKRIDIFKSMEGFEQD